MFTRKNLLAILFIVAASQVYAGCKPVSMDQDDYVPDVAVRKVDYAISVISDSEYLKNEPECVRDAILYLGMRHIEKAIPRLIGLLTYHQEPRVTHLPRRDEEYPAIAGLFNMGEAAVPALIKVLASKDSSSLKNRNALNAFMSIYREDVDMGIRTLKEASEKQTDVQSSLRLHEAADNARALWCRHIACTE